MSSGKSDSRKCAASHAPTSSLNSACSSSFRDDGGVRRDGLPVRSIATKVAADLRPRCRMMSPYKHDRLYYEEPSFVRISGRLAKEVQGPFRDADPVL